MEYSDIYTPLEEYFPKIYKLEKRSFSLQENYNSIKVAGFSGENSFRRWIKDLYEDDLEKLEESLVKVGCSKQKETLMELISQVEDKKAQLVSKFPYKNKKYLWFYRPPVVELDPYDKEKWSQMVIKAEPFVNVFIEELKNLINGLEAQLKKTTENKSPGHQSSFKTDKPHRTFALKDEFRNDEKVAALYNGLMNEKFIESQSIEDFSLIFSGDRVTNTVIWAGGYNELKYFIDCINKIKFFGKKLTQPYAVAAECFIKEDGSEIKPSKISGADDPPAKKTIILELIAKMGT